MPTAAYICFASASGSMAAWITNPTFLYKSFSTGLLNQTNTSTTPQLNIVNGFSVATLAGSGLLAANGNGTIQTLAYIFLQFSTDII